MEIPRVRGNQDNRGLMAEDADLNAKSDVDELGQRETHRPSPQTRRQKRVKN